MQFKYPFRNQYFKKCAKVPYRTYMSDRIFNIWFNKLKFKSLIHIKGIKSKYKDGLRFFRETKERRTQVPV